MSKIFGSNSEVGDWMFTPFTDGNADKLSNLKDGIDASEVVEARAEIERCAKSGEIFYYGEGTSNDVKKDLNEYAEAVGLSKDKMESVSSEKIRTSKIISEVESAQVEEPTQAAELIFDIMPTIATDESAFVKDNSWMDQKSSTAKTMEYRPDDNGVIPIRGGEEYESNPVKGVRPGENSIANPDAIDVFATSEDKDSAQAIREANEKRRNENIFDVDSWESDKIAQMNRDSIIPNNGIHMVESPLSQSNTPDRAWDQSIVANEESAPMPEKTAGEQLSEINEQKRSSITRESESDDWEQLESSVRTTVSDLFFENLEKNLKNQEQ